MSYTREKRKRTINERQRKREREHTHTRTTTRNKHKTHRRESKHEARESGRGNRWRRNIDETTKTSLPDTEIDPMNNVVSPNPTKNGH